MEGSGMWYHVMARGDDGRVLFAHQREFRNFLERLGQLCALFKIEVHAYAVMGTHVHLFVCTTEPNLSRFMQRLLTGYSVWYNRRRERTGHVFQGRYKAIVVDRDDYGADVSRYIHLNPARAQTAGDLARMRQTARSYPWSSYRAYLGLAPAPAFLCTHATLEAFGGDTAKARAKYAEFVESGLLRDVPELGEQVKAQSVLGSDAFIERMRRAVVESGTHDDTARRTSERLASIPVERVLGAVARLYDVDAGQVRASKWQHTEARRVALWAAYTWCHGGLALRELGRMFGGVSGMAVCKAAKSVARAMAQDARLRRRLEQVGRQLGVAHEATPAAPGRRAGAAQRAPMRKV